MILHGPDHCVSVGVCVTVEAEIAAGIISADVPGDIASACNILWRYVIILCQITGLGTVRINTHA